MAEVGCHALSHVVTPASIACPRNRPWHRRHCISICISSAHAVRTRRHSGEMARKEKVVPFGIWAGIGFARPQKSTKVIAIQCRSHRSKSSARFSLPHLSHTHTRVRAHTHARPAELDVIRSARGGRRKRHLMKGKEKRRERGCKTRPGMKPNRRCVPGAGVRNIGCGKPEAGKCTMQHGDDALARRRWAGLVASACANLSGVGKALDVVTRRRSFSVCVS